MLFRGGNGALAIARSLGRLGVKTYLVAQTGTSPVSRSRYWVEKFSWDFDEPADRTVHFLLRVGEQIGGRPVLLTLADWAAIFIEDNAAALSERFVFPRPALPVVRALANKWQMFELAKRHGIPTPETAYPQTRADVEDFVRSARFPVMLKGADSFLPSPPKEVVYNERDLFARFDRAAATGAPNVILQEYIPGDAESVWMCNAYFGRGSACHAIFTGKKLRQVSDTGVASLAVCLPNETVENATRSFMQAVGYEGAVGIGYRFDARDGRYKVLDVNARVSGVFRLFRATNGLDVVRVCYLDLTGQAIPATRLSVGRKWMLEDDFEAAFRAMRAGTLTFGRWLQSLRGVRETQWFAADDPAPFLAWSARFLRWLLQAAWKKSVSLPKRRGRRKERRNAA